MSHYTQSNSSLISTEYIGGLVSGFEDWIAIPLGNNTTVILQGTFDKDVTNDGVVSFEGEKWYVERVSESGSYNTYYETTYTSQSFDTFEVDNSYYCRGSLSDTSLLQSTRGQTGMNILVCSIIMGVAIWVVLKDFLSWGLRSRF